MFYKHAFLVFFLFFFSSDYESRGPEFDPHRRHRVVSLSKTHYLPTVLVKPRNSRLRPDMTEKLLTGMISLNTNKQTRCFSQDLVSVFLNNFDFVKFVVFDKNDIVLYSL